MKAKAKPRTWTGYAAVRGKELLSVSKRKWMARAMASDRRDIIRVKVTEVK